MKKQRECPVCGRWFTKRSGNHIYCSISCRNRFYRNETEYRERIERARRQCKAMSAIARFVRTRCRGCGGYSQKFCPPACELASINRILEKYNV